MQMAAETKVRPLTSPIILGCLLQRSLTFITFCCILPLLYQVRGECVQPRYIAGYNPSSSAGHVPFADAQLSVPMVPVVPMDAYTQPQSLQPQSQQAWPTYNNTEQQQPQQPMPYMPQSQQPMPYSIQQQPPPLTQGGYYAPAPSRY